MPQAIPVEQFEATLGSEVHLEYGTSAPAPTIAQLSSEITYLNPEGSGSGVNMIRDSSQASAASLIQLAQQSGCKIDIYWSYNPGGNSTIANYIAQIKQLAAAGVLGLVEGGLEVDNSAWSMVSGGSTYTALNGKTYSGWQAVVESQLDIYNSVKAINPNIKVALWSLANPADGLSSSPAVTAMQQLGVTVNQLADEGNVHFYPHNGDNPASEVGWSFGDETGYDGNLPFAVTEEGFLNGGPNGTNDDPTWVGNPTVNGVYIAEDYLDSFVAGSKTSIQYELNSDATYAWGADGDFGMFNDDGTPRLGATIIHNLMTEIGEAPTSATKSGTLNYTISGLPNPADQLLTEKSSGVFDLTLWDDQQLISSSGASITPTTENVTVTFGQVEGEVKVYNPLTGAVVSDQKNVGSVNLSFGGQPMVVDVTPAGASPVAMNGSSNLPIAAAPSSDPAIPADAGTQTFGVNFENSSNAIFAPNGPFNNTFTEWNVNTLSSNSEDETYMWYNSAYDPFSFTSSGMNIQAEKTPNGVAPTSWVSGMLDTGPLAQGGTDIFSQKYGYFSLTAQCPAGQGSWPSFWLISDSGAYEIDIFEELSNDTTHLHFTVHVPTGNGGLSQDIAMPAGTAWNTAMHTYGLDWTPTALTLYVDGKAIASDNGDAAALQAAPALHMIVNEAVGGNSGWAGQPDSTTPSPMVMKVQDVEAYAYNSSGTVTPPTSPAPQPVTVGSGNDSLVVTVNEDYYQGDAQFTVSVDGTQVGGTQTTTAIHSSGQTQTFTFKGNWGAGVHNVTVNFLNDAYGGSPTADRNLYVTDMKYDGTDYPSDTAAFYNSGPVNFSVGTPVPVAPVTLTDTNDKIQLFVSEDYYQGDAQFTISVDGVQVGGTQTTTAIHSSGQTQEYDILGSWGTGAHTVTVNFLNDAYGGTPTTDRNLYVTDLKYDGVDHPEDTATMYNNGPVTLSFDPPASGVTSTPTVVTPGSAGTNVTMPQDQLQFIGPSMKGQVTGLYEAILNRAPDLTGVNYWANSGLNATAIANGLLASPEASSLSGLSNQAFVEEMYHNALGRPSDPGGSGYWTNALNTGVTRAALAVDFSQTTEALGKIVTGIQNGTFNVH